MSKVILITGGAGFVGSSLAINLKKNYPDYQIYVMDNLKRKGSELNVRRLGDANISFIHGDIRNREDFNAVPSEVNFIIEASAEPSVLAGINGAPDYLINTNLLGTINCLNFAKSLGAGFIFLSTSRIYPIQTLENIDFIEQETRFAISDIQSIPGVSTKGIAEKFPLDGYRSLYGATKLASELIIQEYNHFYGLKTVINRCGVISGPWQMGKVDQGVIVLWVAKHYWKQELAYIGYNGTGKQLRDALHIEDLYRLIDYQLHHISSINGQVFNAGGGEAANVSLLELTQICQQVTGNTIPIKKITENRQADIRIYISDNSKIKQHTGWSPQISIFGIVEDIFRWIQDNEKQLESILK